MGDGVLGYYSARDNALLTHLYERAWTPSELSNPCQCSSGQEPKDERLVEPVSRNVALFEPLKRIWREIKNSFEDAPQFDVLIIPGSFSLANVPDSASTFITRQAENLLAMLSISSGVLMLAQTGLLKEKRATGPPSLFPSLRQRYPETLWQDSPWTRHNNIWSSNSAITAMDMMTAWLREYFWDRSEAVECALRAAGIPPLEEEYE